MVRQYISYFYDLKHPHSFNKKTKRVKHNIRGQGLCKLQRVFLGKRIMQLIFLIWSKKIVSYFLRGNFHFFCYCFWFLRNKSTSPSMHIRTFRKLKLSKFSLRFSSRCRPISGRAIEYSNRGVVNNAHAYETPVSY